MAKKKNIINQIRGDNIRIKDLVVQDAVTDMYRVNPHKQVKETGIGSDIAVRDYDPVTQKPVGKWKEREIKMNN